MSREVRVAIIGSRDWPNAHAVKDAVDALPDGTVVVSGGAFGPDRWAQTAADMRGLMCVVVRPGKESDARQYHARNRVIVDASDRVIAFWDGTSPGTKATIDYAKRTGKPVDVRRLP